MKNGELLNNFGVINAEEGKDILCSNLRRRHYFLYCHIATPAFLFRKSRFRWCSIL